VAIELLPFDDVVQHILGLPNFTTGPIAHRLRALGIADIKPKMEAEQAYVMYWLLGLYVKHGDAWAIEADKILKPVKEPT